MGRRQFHRIGPFAPERGGLIDVTVAYETWGRLNAAGDNAVLVLHALTGDSHIRGPAGPGHPTAGWWTDLIGPGAPVDTDKYFVLAPNALGGCQGTTGPASVFRPAGAPGLPGLSDAAGSGPAGLSASAYSAGPAGLSDAAGS
ncbi:MAG: hypothetical protein LBD70_02200, partial [Bifidobacteriaceae bacterium]|nr:hypothetical protein [Bifidobacteriaceae bacterium]